jgi:hypothetical protein
MRAIEKASAAIVATTVIANQTTSHVLTRGCYTSAPVPLECGRTQPVPPLEARNSSM